jgi:hypothetical protein
MDSQPLQSERQLAQTSMNERLGCGIFGTPNRSFPFLETESWQQQRELEISIRSLERDILFELRNLQSRRTIPVIAKIKCTTDMRRIQSGLDNHAYDMGLSAAKLMFVSRWLKETSPKRPSVLERRVRGIYSQRRISGKLFLVRQRNKLLRRLMRSRGVSERMMADSPYCPDVQLRHVRGALLDVRSIAGADDHRSKLLKDVDRGLRFLVHHVVVIMVTDYRHVTRYQPRTKVAWDIIASTHSFVLKHLIEGDLIRKVLSKSESGMGSYLELINKTKIQNLRVKGLPRDIVSQPPCIYAIFFTDREGNSPTIGHLLRILKGMERYCNRVGVTDEDGRWAQKIDSMVYNSQWVRYGTFGGRKYLDEVRARFHGAGLPTSRERHLKEFIKSVKQRITASEQEGLIISYSDRLEPPLTYVGYTSDYRRRFQQHKSHTTNYIMNLMEAISLHLFGDRYQIRSLVIYRIWESPQASVGEILFSILANAKYNSGSGFCINDPGVAIRSVRNYNMEQWQSFKNKAYKDTPYLANLELEKARVGLARYNVRGALEAKRILEGILHYLKQAGQETSGASAT